MWNAEFSLSYLYVFPSAYTSDACSGPCRSSCLHPADAASLRLAGAGTLKSIRLELPHAEIGASLRRSRNGQPFGRRCGNRILSQSLSLSHQKPAVGTA